jgi:2-polyprenyl-6-methoxyphenol hydroxylase-like FAD-dependent oxidoreductase
VSATKQGDIVVPAKSILISGAGIAGPTLAYWLDRYGFDVTLVERAPRPRTGGYIIDFWGLGYDVADRMQLVRALEQRGYKVEELRFVDNQGRRVGGFGADVFRHLTGGRYLSLPRSALAKLLSDVIAERCPIIFGDSVRELIQTDTGIDVSFERAPRRHFDLVIGADGQHSVVRKLAFGEEDRFERYLGYVVSAFEGTQYRPRDQNVYVSYALPGKQVARFALRDDHTLFLLVFTATRPPAVPPHDTRAQKAYLHVEFDGSGWECGRILDAMDRCDEIYFDRVSQIHLRRWSHNRVALVGDAAAAPSLLAGQGAALAMTAAYVLAGELARARGDHRQAFARYEAMLREFLDGKQASAQRFAGSFLPHTRLGILLRNQVTKLFGIPAVANFVLGRGLLDRLSLPDYPSELERTGRMR